MAMPSKGAAAEATMEQQAGARARFMTWKYVSIDTRVNRERLLSRDNWKLRRVEMRLIPASGWTALRPDDAVDLSQRADVP